MKRKTEKVFPDDIQLNSDFDAEETLEGENTSSGASNPISNNISLINKIQASYGQYSQEVQSNLAILV